MPGMDASLRGIVGGPTATALADNIDVQTLGDLVRHYPRRFDRLGELTDLASLRVGEEVTVQARVTGVSVIPVRTKLRKLLRVQIGDGQHTVSLTFFGERQLYRQRELRHNVLGLFSGTVKVFKDQVQLDQPAYLLFDEDGQLLRGSGHPLKRMAAGQTADEVLDTLIPVYPATKKCGTWTIYDAVETALPQLEVPADPLPTQIRQRHHLPDLLPALYAMHRPRSVEDRTSATRRLKWDEALVLQVTLAQRRWQAAQDPATARPPVGGGIAEAFDARLPFALTDGQQTIGATLAEELADEQPMHRLLQGEVGSGKTICALRAMLQVVDAGGQAALLAPTEVLAAQHHRSLTELLGPLAAAGQLGAAERATRVTLLTGSQNTATRKRALLDAASGDAGIVIGTHALIQDRVQFADLGLVVIDEQHRFGVEQRDALRAKGSRPPHVLVMTATPIPRTVAMTVFGDLDVSTLAELPRGRAPITTTVVPNNKPAWMNRTWERVHEEVAAGHQAFVVAPRIGDESAADDVRAEEGDEEEGRRPPLAVLDVAPRLIDGPLAGLALEVLHGRLSAEEKDAVMARFVAGETEVLVATTVIEVGVDVPNATVMVVLDADRFGVSQLHQLRGRIGRGSAPGLCLLVSDSPAGTPATERLTAVAATNDGFALARLDLEQRREGDVLGARQSGRRGSLRLLSLLRDEDLISEARQVAQEIVAADPRLAQHAALAEAVAGLVDDERADYLEKA